MDAALTGRLAQLDGAPLRPDEGRLAARRRAEALDAAIRRFTPPDLQRAAVAAIGGYGRSELTPGSDVDLLIVYEPDAEDEAATVAEAILYPLWDAGLAVGHAVRTLGECAFEVRRNVDSLTAMLSARLLDGSELLVQMARKAALDVVRADRARFVALLRQGRGEREARFGRLGRTQDPHLKESLGGLRDLQCLGWLEASLGVSPSPAQRIALDEGLDLILAARAALHRVMAGRDDRLADGQREAVARELGFEPEPGWEGRDVMMRALARAGRRTAAIADELLASADGAEQAAVDPRTEAFVRMVGEGRWTPEALDAFVLLVADGGGDAVIHALDEHSLLDELLPGWSDLAGRPQHDPYHRYPVDVHLTEAATAAARMLAEAEAEAEAGAGAEAGVGAGADAGAGADPVARAAADAVTDPGALVLGALLHDAGKIGLGSHVSIGAEVAGRVLDRMGLTEGARRDLVLFLVREHLLLSDTATRRNLEDEDLILHVAARVRDRERLGMLYLLTMADAHATGPSASTPWRTGLIRELAAKVDRAFDRGLMDPDRASAVERAEIAVRNALLAHGTEPGDVQRFLDVTPPAYALWVDADQAPDHLKLVLPPPTPGEARVGVAPGRSPDTWAVTVGARDRLGLLATMAGAFAVSGISILTARAFTTSDGVALDAFEVSGSFEDGISEDRWDRFRTLLTGALDGTIDLDERITEWRSHYRPPPSDVRVKVSVAEDVSDYFTLVEVQTADRLGLLFDLAGAFADAGVDVHVAQAATYGPRIVDVFYVTEGSGGKVEDPDRLDALRRALATAAGAGEG